MKIYRKLLAQLVARGRSCAPGTLEMMAQFSVLTRLKEPENSSIYSKMRVYDGETLKDVDPKAKTLQEYRDYAGADEGMTGMSTRFAYKILSAVFNHDQAEIAANPVHLMYVLEQRLAREQLPDETRRRCVEFIKGYLAPRYAEFIGKEIQTAYLESYAEYGQNIFDRYVTFADCWIQDEDFRDPETGEMLRSRARSTRSWRRSRSRPASPIRRTSATRSSISCCGRAPTTTATTRAGRSYEKLREVIEKKMFSNTEDLLPVISFNAKASADEKEKHQNFVARMVAKGYTEKQVRLLARVVPARAQVVVTGAGADPEVRPMLHLIDRRPNGRGKSAVNRERFLRRYKAQIQDAVKKMVGERRHRRHGARRRSSRAEEGHRRAVVRLRPRRRPRIRAAGQPRIRRRATAFPGPTAAAARAAAAAKAARATARTTSSSRCRAKSSCEIFFDDLELPNLARTELGRMRAAQSDAPAITKTGAPANLVGRAHAAQALARRIALSAGLAREMEALDANSRWRSRPEQRRTGARDCTRSSSGSRGGATALPFLDELDLRYRNRVVAPEPDRARGDVLPDGRLGVDGRGQEGPRQALLHAALPLPRPASTARSTWSSSATPTTPRRSTRRRSSTTRAPAAPSSSRRSSSMETDRRRALSPERLEHLRGAGLRRRRLRRRSGAQRALPARAAAAGARYYTYLELADRSDREHARQPVGRIRARGRGDAGNFAMRRATRRERDLPGVPRARSARTGVIGDMSVTLARRRLGLRAARALRRSAIGEVARPSTGSTPTRTRSRSSPPSRCSTPTRRAGCRSATRTGRTARSSSATSRRTGAGMQGARLRDRHQLQSLHRLPDGGEHHDDAGAGHRARRATATTPSSRATTCSSSGPRPTRSSTTSSSPRAT